MCPVFLKKVVFATFVLFVSAMAMAEEPLTSAQVENYIKSGPEFKQWSVKNQATLKAAYLQTQQSSPPGTSDRELMEKSMAASGLSGELDALVKPYGFDNSMQYLTISQRIMKAVMTLGVRSAPGGDAATQKRLEEAMARLEQSDMSPEQKAQMRQMMQKTHAQMMAMANAPEEDMAVVKPHMAAIQQAFMAK
jgi:hypothetical protein